MSSNLYKWNYMNLQQEEKRVINTNDLVEKRIEELNIKRQLEENNGFSAGLTASVIDVDDYPQDAEELEALGNNMIKAGEDAESILMQAQQEAEALIEEAKAEAERILSEANAEAIAEKNRVLSEARQRGYTEGAEKATRESERLQQQLNERTKQLEAEYQKCLDELEPQFVDTITGIYEHIFHVELQSYREILVYLIAATMRKIENNRNFMVHVSKDDYPYVSMQKKQIMAGAVSANISLELVEDLTLSKNECLIETEGGIFDCSLGTQLAELGQKLRLLSYEKEKDNR